MPRPVQLRPSAVLASCLLGVVASAATLTPAPQPRSYSSTNPAAGSAAAPTADVAPGAQPSLPAAVTTTAGEPKALSEQVLKGIAWLLSQQLPSGGWGQGDEALSMGDGGGTLKATANVGDTCTATLALMRAGSSPKDGPNAVAICKGLGFVASKIEAADEESLSITDVNGTRLQTKLGPFIDTFLASVVLAEAKGRMPDEASEQRMTAALSKVVRKIERNQKQDGTWNNDGWAPVLAQSMAAKGLNRASQLGADVSEQVLDRATGYAQGGLAAGGGLATTGNAGVALYAGASNLSALREKVNSDELRVKQVQLQAVSAPSADLRDAAKLELAEIAEVKKDCDEMQKNVIDKLDDPSFIAGFGSNGGEEFLSYMNIGEALVRAGGEPWKVWDTKTTSNLNRIQNADGSWTGHHCITGRTFCTSSALLTLMVDRAPVVVAKAAQVAKPMPEPVAPPAEPGAAPALAPPPAAPQAK